MKLIGDYHIHSKFSRFFHGKDSIQDLVNAANAQGLQEIAITDHGFRHLFRTNKQKLAKARKIVDEINETSAVKVLLGIEADIISEDGTLDVDNETLSMIDVLIAGYHKMIRTDFAGYFGTQKDTPEAIQKSTNAYLNAIKRYPINIVSHLNSGIKVDVRQIAEACARENVFVEINNRHLCFSDKDAQDLIDADCLLVVNSDAHSRDEVGSVGKAFEFVKKHKFKTENFLNIQFDYDEMTDEHREINASYSVYQEKLRRKSLVEELNAERHAHEFTNKLSDDMERELMNIAQEKGYKYSKNVVQDDSFDIDMDDNVFDPEAEALLEQARKYIAKADDKDKAENGAATEASEADDLISFGEDEAGLATEAPEDASVEGAGSDKKTTSKAKSSANNAGSAAKDEDFKFNMGLKDARATKQKNKGTKVQKTDKSKAEEKPKNTKKKGKVLV